MFICNSTIPIVKIDYLIAAIRHKKHKNQISGLVNPMCYKEQKLKFRLFTNPSYFITAFLLVFYLQASIISASAQQIKIMPIGDSITPGHILLGIPLEEFQVSYRKALYDKLKAAGYVVNDGEIRRHPFFRRIGDRL